MDGSNAAVGRRKSSSYGSPTNAMPNNGTVGILRKATIKGAANITALDGVPTARGLEGGVIQPHKKKNSFDGKYRWWIDPNH